MKTEPVEPVKPEQNKKAKHELTIAMAAAITAVAKIKGVKINHAEIEGGSPFKCSIELVIEDDEKVWEEYEKKYSSYTKEWTTWKHEQDCIKFGITEEQRQIAEKKYYEFRKETGYKFPEIKPLEEFYKEVAS